MGDELFKWRANEIGLNNIPNNSSRKNIFSNSFTILRHIAVPMKFNLFLIKSLHPNKLEIVYVFIWGIYKTNSMFVESSYISVNLNQLDNSF